MGCSHRSGEASSSTPQNLSHQAGDAGGQGGRGESAAGSRPHRRRGEVPEEGGLQLGRI